MNCPKCGSEYSQRVGWAGCNEKYACGSIYNTGTLIRETVECDLRSQLTRSQQEAKDWESRSLQYAKCHAFMDAVAEYLINTPELTYEEHVRYAREMQAACIQELESPQSTEQ